jgi:ubiquinone/menaquinone biosynthesis C-methylase UbiE
MTDYRAFYDELLEHEGAAPIAFARTRDTADSVPVEVRAVLPSIPEEIRAGYHEFGSPIPPAIDGLTVLDLGCGTGRDSYVASKLVGEQGRVIGFDVDVAKLDVARRFQGSLAGQFGYAASNVEFIQGVYEDLSAIPDASVNVVFSNCVLNTAKDKEQVFAEIWRVLKDSGELFFTDVYSDRRIAAELADDPSLRAARLSGALYVEDIRRLTSQVGWANYRYYARRRTPLSAPEAEALDGYAFATITLRAVKKPDLMEDICENYGQKLTYLGTIPGYEDGFRMDEDVYFPTNEALPVCGICTAIFGSGHYAPYFKVEGDRSVHYGDMHGDLLIKTALSYSA